MTVLKKVGYDLEKVTADLDRIIESMRADLGILSPDQQDSVISTFKTALRKILADSGRESLMDLLAFVTANKNSSSSYIPEYVWAGPIGDFLRDKMLETIEQTGDKLITAWEAICILWPNEAIKSPGQENFEKQISPKLYMRLNALYKPKAGNPILLFPLFILGGRITDSRIYFSLSQVQHLAQRLAKE